MHWWGTHTLWKKSRHLGSFYLPEPSLWGCHLLLSPDRAPQSSRPQPPPRYNVLLGTLL